ncbi:LOW QUALITY PROTEIN: Fatty acid synthase subunit beta, partial [Frankliniella fusca]
EVDRHLLTLTITTTDISRVPCSLVERSDFRSHDVTVLKDILPPRFFNHCALLVHGVVLLVQNSVAKSEVVYASRYFKQFNEEIDVLYVHVTFSVHLVTHLENCVINFAQPCLIRLLFSKISMVSEKVLLIAAMV